MSGELRENIEPSTNSQYNSLNLKIYIMYYLVKLRFEVDQENGKIKNVKEQHLVDAISVSDAETRVLNKFGSGISPLYIEGVQESKILSVLEG